MLVAIATHPEHETVKRFGHDFPVLMIEINEDRVQSTRSLVHEGGCCRTLVARLAGVDLLMCTGLGPGAARHLSEMGVAVATVAEGTSVSTALTSALQQTWPTGVVEPSGCGGHQGHHENCHHDGESEHACGCHGAEARSS